MSSRIPHFAPWAVMLTLASTGSLACVTPQILRVTSTPSGATVELRRMGTVESSTAVLIFASHHSEPIQEEYTLIGTTPLEHVFDRVEPESSANAIVVTHDSSRVYSQGVIRVRLKGYKDALRRVRFTGDPMDVAVVLEPEEAAPSPPARAAPSNDPTAAPPDLSNSAADEAAIHEAQAKLRFAGEQWAAAAAEFAAAYAANRDPIFLFNQAICYRRLGDNQLAVAFYKKFVTEAPDNPNRGVAEERIRTLEREIAEGKSPTPSLPPANPSP